MTISYIGAGARTLTGLSAATITVDIPAGNVGDLLIGILGIATSGTSNRVGFGGVKFPEPWQAALVGPTLSDVIGYKIAGEASESDITIEIPGGPYWNGSAYFGNYLSYAQVFRYRSTVGFRYGDVIGATQTNGGSGTTASCTGVTTTRNNSAALYFIESVVNTAIGTPGGYTENVDEGNSSIIVHRMSQGFNTVATSGSSSGNISVSVGNNVWQVVIIEIREYDNAGISTQYAYPALDISPAQTGLTYNGWVTSSSDAQSGSYFDKIDDGGVADDSDWIESRNFQNLDVVGIGLTALQDPGTSSGHVLRVRAMSQDSSDIYVELMQGVTVIASRQQTLTASFATYEFTLSSGETNAITDYKNLWVRMKPVAT